MQQTLHLNQRPQSTILQAQPNNTNQQNQQEPNQQQAQLTPPEPAQNQATPPVQSQSNNQPPQQSNDTFVSTDDFLREFTTPRENTAQNQQEEPAAGLDVPPVQEPPLFYTAPETLPADRPEMSDAEARKQTITLMNMRQTAQSCGIAFYADGTLDTVPQYKYSPQAFNELVEAWMPVVQQARIKVPPFANILFVEAIHSGPLVGLMMQNRKNRKRIEQLEKQLVNEQRKNHAVATMRKDTATAWKIDKNGYFVNQPNNTYIQEGKRTEKPRVDNEEIYNMLIKHNGIDAVHAAFNIKQNG